MPSPLERLRWRLARVRSRVNELGGPRVLNAPQHPPQPLRLPRRYRRGPVPVGGPSISVVTPAIGWGPFVDATLESVASQRYPHTEHIVQDGGGTSPPPQAEHWAGRVRWICEPDRGQADALNRGFARASGDVLAWLNDDDIFLPGALSYVGRYLTNHPDVDAVFGQRLLLDANGMVVGRHVMPASVIEGFGAGNFLPQEALFIRRSAWDAAGGRVDSDLHLTMDWELNQRLVRAGSTIRRVGRYLGGFRIHPDQKTARLGDDLTAEAAVLRERWHGRPVDQAEAWESLTPVMRRHALLHIAHRVGHKLGLQP